MLEIVVPNSRLDRDRIKKIRDELQVWFTPNPGTLRMALYDAGLEPTEFDLSGAMREQIHRVLIQLNAKDPELLRVFLRVILSEFTDGGRRVPEHMKHTAEAAWVAQVPKRPVTFTQGEPNVHFLDEPNFNWSRNESLHLLNLLLYAFPTLESSEQAAARGGLRRYEYDQTTNVYDRWWSIIEAAHSRELLRTLIERAAEEPVARKQKADLLKLLKSDYGNSDDNPAPRDVSSSALNAPASAEEKIMGDSNDMLPVSFLERGFDAARSVARLSMRFGRKNYVGTGFLIKEDRLLTAKHNVFLEHGRKANAIMANFRHEREADGRVPEPIERWCELDSVVLGKDSDWALLKLSEPLPAEQCPALSLYEGEAVKTESHANIIHHPLGHKKQISIRNNWVAYSGARELQYLSDTEPGSSGAPVFNDDWQVIAVHTKGGNLPVPDLPTRAYRNSGVPVSFILEELKGR